jgi:two-component system CheB/CheR fusion protein
MASEPSPAEFNRLLDYLKINRGFDFSAYKVSSLVRRIQKRMRDVGVGSYAEYTDYLEVHPNEFGPLFDTVLINVTSFFRDTASWQYLAEQILPRLVDTSGERAIRVWSAGCATGEEAFSAAILLAELLGEEAFRQRVKIYATDADDNALATARQGSYEARQVGGIAPEQLEKYFDAVGNRYIFRTDLRRSLIFGRHDLIQDAAISRLDLLICRNTLMYFNSETQERILARFHFALNKTGYLFLGKAETLLAHSDCFRPVDLRHRVFSRAPNSNLRDRLLALAPAGPQNDTQGDPRQLRIREGAFEAGPVAELAIDRRGYLVAANNRARKLFNLGVAEVGRPFQDLELSYRPVELRSHIEAAQTGRAAVVVKDVELRGTGGEIRHMEIHVAPLLETGGNLGTSIAFIDVTQSQQLRSDLERANQDLETAYEELQSANEELETTNEELQSTVEELETTNEELQSANEELETMNEELQSTNEQLRAMNDRIEQRSEDLDRVNRYLETILASLRAAVVVLDRGLHVTVWSEKAEDLWGMRNDEARGAAFLELDIGLPVGELASSLQDCLSGAREQVTELDGVNRRGRSVRCRVRCSPLLGRGVEGIILLVEELGGEGEGRKEQK